MNRQPSLEERQPTFFPQKYENKEKIVIYDGGYLKFSIQPPAPSLP